MTRPRCLIIFSCLFFILFTHLAWASQSRRFGEVIDDNLIVIALKKRYMKDKTVPAGAISIKSWKGTVTLRGELNDQEQINRAIEIAEAERGVREVKAYLVLKEFGSLREEKPKSDRTPFFKSLFTSKNSQKTKIKKSGDNRDELKEVDLSSSSTKNSDSNTDQSPSNNTNDSQNFDEGL